MRRRDRSGGIIFLTWPFTVLILSIWMWPHPVSSSLEQTSEQSFRSTATLAGIDIKETSEGAVVIFSIDDASKDPSVDYKVTTSVRLSGKWIDLEFPAIRTGMYENVVTGGEILGKILVEETPDGAGTRISIEILPASINYDIRQEDGSLVFSVTTQ